MLQDNFMMFNNYCLRFSLRYIVITQYCEHQVIRRSSQLTLLLSNYYYTSGHIVKCYLKKEDFELCPLNHGLRPATAGCSRQLTRIVSRDTRIAQTLPLQRTRGRITPLYTIIIVIICIRALYRCNIIYYFLLK